MMGEKTEDRAAKTDALRRVLEQEATLRVAQEEFLTLCGWEKIRPGVWKSPWDGQTWHIAQAVAYQMKDFRHDA